MFIQKESSLWALQPGHQCVRTTYCILNYDIQKILTIYMYKNIDMMRSKCIDIRVISSVVSSWIISLMHETKSHPLSVGSDRYNATALWSDTSIAIYNTCTALHRRHENDVPDRDFSTNSFFSQFEWGIFAKHTVQLIYLNNVFHVFSILSRSGETVQPSDHR